jgi:branched-chain amino acid transport system permease protein
MTPSTGRRTLILVAIAVPIIVIFATALLAMNLLMALILGAFLAARLLFPEDSRVTRAVVIGAIIWALCLPLVHDEGGDFMRIGTLILAYSVMALGLNIIVGYAGLLDLGYVAFFALGALTAGWFMSDFFANAGGREEGIHVGVSEFTSNLFGIHFNFLIVVVIAVVICTIAGMIIGLPTLRLRGDYIAIVTLAFGEIIGRIVINGDQLHFGDAPLVGGALENVFGEGAVFSAGREGITPIDKIYLPPLNGGEQFETLNLTWWFWVALGMVFIVLFVNYRLRDSRLGRAWIALREDEVAAASMGVPLVRTKLLAYGTGAAFGGISGAFLASRLSVVNADQFQFFFSIFILAMVILGGLGSIEGVLIGAGVLVYLNFEFIPDLNDKPREWFNVDLDMSELSSAIYGFLLVLMMLLRPQGLIPERRRKMELVEHVGAGKTTGVGGPSDEALYEARA